MTDIKVSTLGVPRTPRNKRIYSYYKSERISIGIPANVANSTIPRNVQAKLLSYDNGDFVDRNISVLFQTPFIAKPVGWIKVYRYESRAGGGYFYTNAIYYVADSDWLTNIGFDIIVEDYENLTGLIVEYNFTERTNDEE